MLIRLPGCMLIRLLNMTSDCLLHQVAAAEAAREIAERERTSLAAALAGAKAATEVASHALHASEAAADAAKAQVRSTDDLR